jgi:hypothetical protein
MKKIWNHFKESYIGIQSTLFTVFAIANFFIGNSDRFWMFMIASILFSALQTIIDELRTKHKQK